MQLQMYKYNIRVENIVLDRKIIKYKKTLKQRVKFRFIQKLNGNKNEQPM